MHPELASPNPYGTKRRAAWSPGWCKHGSRQSTRFCEGRRLWRTADGGGASCQFRSRTRWPVVSSTGDGRRAGRWPGAFLGGGPPGSAGVPGVQSPAVIGPSAEGGWSAGPRRALVVRRRPQAHLLCFGHQAHLEFSGLGRDDLSSMLGWGCGRSSSSLVSPGVLGCLVRPMVYLQLRSP